MLTDTMYTTSSLPLASYLCTLDDVKFVGIDKSEPTKILFQFSPAEKAQLATDEYFSGRASANPMDIFKNFHFLKDMVFEVKRNMPADPTPHWQS